MSTVPATDSAAAAQPLPPLDAADPQHLAVTFADHGTEVVAHITGEIDMVTCGRLRDAIEPHLGSGQRVVLDLSGVTFMDSSCLGVLEHARTRLSEDGGSLVLRNPSRIAHRLISVAGLTKLFSIQIG